MKLTENELRELAKDEGISRAGNKKVDTLLEEFKEKGITDIEVVEPEPEVKDDAPEETKTEPVVDTAPVRRDSIVPTDGANPEGFEPILMAFPNNKTKVPHKVWQRVRDKDALIAQGWIVVG